MQEYPDVELDLKGGKIAVFELVQLLTVDLNKWKFMREKQPLDLGDEIGEDEISIVTIPGR